MPNTKEKLVELLNDVCAKGFWRYGVDQKTCEEGGHEMTAEDIADYLMENTVQKWIPVTERLPEKDGEHILVCYKDGWVCDQYTPVDRGVTHWMPLPEPPKGE